MPDRAAYPMLPSNAARQEAGTSMEKAGKKTKRPPEGSPCPARVPIRDRGRDEGTGRRSPPGSKGDPEHRRPATGSPTTSNSVDLVVSVRHTAKGAWTTSRGSRPGKVFLRAPTLSSLHPLHYGHCGSSPLSALQRWGWTPTRFRACPAYPPCSPSATRTALRSPSPESHKGFGVRHDH